MRTVHIVYTEFQNGECGIAGVFESAADAEAHAAGVARDWARMDRIVCGRNPATGAIDPDADDPEWDLDVHVEAHPITRASLPCNCGDVGPRECEQHGPRE